ncbi:putative N-acetyltransferase YjcF [Kordia antarctica]|uniref:Putative N-acetyltransferase YjcF n=1 Tax=Kordia antarctica TaxID=1218801 RepID=A0A7L4ZLZ6_9FLAO|nr:GNAT family N-acetyltransferase [Kordia antarctica]QHI37531.1 putative N-acetyltransferase YjcF [Kordia antarctica]
MLTVKVKSFSEFTIDELHDVFQLRSEVFVVEQDCVYQDIDGKDRKALHVIGCDENEKIVAYTRLFNAGDYFDNASIGRVVVSENARAFKYGHAIMKASIAAIEQHYNTKNIKISAQTYLKKFYESHGFTQVGDEYLEDGIPHIGMVR